MFLDEFAQLVKSVVITDIHILICGDFNLHVDDINDHDTARFLNILDSFKLCQHITGPTHKCGHSLDLLITRSDETLVNNTRVLPDVYSDHHLITCKLECPKPPLSKVLVSYRPKKVNQAIIRQSILESPLQHLSSVHDLSVLVEMYDSTLTSVLSITL